MTTRDDALDRRARQAHAASLDALSPRVQAQLAQRRRAALAGHARPDHRRWGWIGAAATACVLVVALQLRPPSPDPIDAPTRVSAAAAPASPADPGGMLAEDPDFYLWLASGEAQALAME